MIRLRKDCPSSSQYRNGVLHREHSTRGRPSATRRISTDLSASMPQGMRMREWTLCLRIAFIPSRSVKAIGQTLTELINDDNKIRLS